MKDNDEKENTFKIIGLTGGVGAGKSSVLAWLKEAYGAHIIVTDEVGHRLMEPGKASYERLVERIFWERMERFYGISWQRLFSRMKNP